MRTSLWRSTFKWSHKTGMTFGSWDSWTTTKVWKTCKKRSYTLEKLIPTVAWNLHFREWGQALISLTQLEECPQQLPTMLHPQATHQRKEPPPPATLTSRHKIGWELCVCTFGNKLFHEYVQKFLEILVDTSCVSGWVCFISAKRIIYWFSLKCQIRSCNVNFDTHGVNNWGLSFLKYWAWHDHVYKICMTFWFVVAINSPMWTNCDAYLCSFSGFWWLLVLLCSTSDFYFEFITFFLWLLWSGATNHERNLNGQFEYIVKKHTPGSRNSGPPSWNMKWFNKVIIFGYLQ